MKMSEMTSCVLVCCLVLIGFSIFLLEIFQLEPGREISGKAPPGPMWGNGDRLGQLPDGTGKSPAHLGEE